MNRHLVFARANGWPRLIVRVVRGLLWRVRDDYTARQLKAPGFRAGRSPRILGLSHMHLGPDFHAADHLWLEAVVSYEERTAGHLFEPQLTMGASARLSDNVHIACLHRVTIGDHLLAGSHVLISDHAHGRYQGMEASAPGIPPAQRDLHSPAPVSIGDNVWLGDGVVVLPGAVIGDGCVIGANAVVTGFVPANCIAVGAPARPIREWDAATGTWIPVSEVKRPSR